MKFSVWITVVALVSAAVGKPYVSRRSAIVSQEHPFDLGPVTACVTAPSTSSCPTVDYDIPATVASSLDIRTATIEPIMKLFTTSVHPNEDNRECIENFRKELCEFHLPKCTEKNDGTNAIEIKFNCTRALSQCPDVGSALGDLSAFCPELGDMGGTYDLEKCSPQPVQEQTDLNIADCRRYADSSLPSWISAYLKILGNSLDVQYDHLLSTSKQDDFVLQGCLVGWLNVSCQSFGRCWAQGERLEYFHSREDCQSLDVCASNKRYKNVFDQLECPSLPVEASRLVTEYTPFTNVTTSPSVSTSPDTTASSPQGSITIYLGSGSQRVTISILTSLLLALSVLLLV